MTTGPATEGSNKPPCLREDALAVLTRLREAGHVAYFAGGCVRDELLGLTPKDYDVATDAPPDRVRQLFTNTQAVGAAFGVILVRHKKSVVEVATFRTDGKYLDGRRPEAVTFTTAEEDAKRRDFTINGLFLDPVENRVIDYVGGQEDLKNKVLRAIGDPNHRFEEDHLRLLRAIRFAARFQLEIGQETANAIAAHAEHLKRISPERVSEELRLTLTPPMRIRAWEMIDRFRLDEVIFRYLELPWPSPHPEVSGQRSTILYSRLAPGQPIPFGLALAAATLEYASRRLAHLVDWSRVINEITVRAMIRALRQSLRISNEEADSMEGTLYGVETLLARHMPSVATLKRFLARPSAALSRRLLAALPLVGDDDARRADVERRLSELEQTEYAPAPLITGDDLTDAGLKPGKAFKIALDQTYDAQLEGRVTSRKEALEMAIGIAKSVAG